jgi:hypothetical protein
MNGGRRRHSRGRPLRRDRHRPAGHERGPCLPGGFLRLLGGPTTGDRPATGTSGIGAAAGTDACRLARRRLRLCRHTFGDAHAAVPGQYRTQPVPEWRYLGGGTAMTAD